MRKKDDGILTSCTLLAAAVSVQSCKGLAFVIEIEMAHSLNFIDVSGVSQNR